MIQPVKLRYNVAFQSSNAESNFHPKTSKEAIILDENKQAPTQSKMQTLIQKGVKLLKKFNNVAYPSTGIIQGTVEGVGVAAIIGAIGKNAKKSNGKILGTIGGTLKDAAVGIGKTIGFVPSVVTKAPLENAKTVLTLPKKFYCEYLKDNKLTASLATVGALSMIGLRYVQGHINANKANAGLDHKVGGTHKK